MLEPQRTTVSGHKQDISAQWDVFKAIVWPNKMHKVYLFIIPNTTFQLRQLAGFALELLL